MKIHMGFGSQLGAATDGSTWLFRSPFVHNQIANPQQTAQQVWRLLNMGLNSTASLFAPGASAVMLVVVYNVIACRKELRRQVE